MAKAEHPPNPTCPMCEQEVLPGDHVVFAHAEIIHLNCHFQRNGLADSVAHLLRRRAGEDYCHTCLARLLQATYEQIAKAVTALRMTSRYRVTTMAACSVCGMYRTTVRAEPPSVGGDSQGVRPPLVHG